MRGDAADGLAGVRQEGPGPGRRGHGLGDALADKLGRMRHAAQEDAFRGKIHWPQLGVGLGIEVVLVVGDAEFLGQLIGTLAGLHRRSQHYQVGLDLHLEVARRGLDEATTRP